MRRPFLLRPGPPAQFRHDDCVLRKQGSGRLNGEAIRWVVPEKVAEAAATVPVRHDHDLVEQALARYAGGESRSEIATELHIHPATLSLWVRTSGIKPNRARPRRVDDDYIQTVVNAYRQAGSFRGAAKILDCCWTTVRWNLQHHAPDVLAQIDEGDCSRSGDPQLPVEPIKRLLDQCVSRGMVIAKIAKDADTTSRRINAIRNREYRTVRLSTADKLCIAVGESLAVIYPAEAAEPVAAAA